MLIKLVAFERIGKAQEGYVLVDTEGTTILLGDMLGMEETTTRLALLPDSKLLEGQVLLALFYYNRENNRLQTQPLSIITEDMVVRMLY